MQPLFTDGQPSKRAPSLSMTSPATTVRLIRRTARAALQLRYTGQQHRSTIASPVLLGSDVLGVIVVTRTIFQPFAPGEVALVESIAEQMAVVIGNARATEQLAERNAELAASVEREAALARISQRINEHPLDVEGTLLAIAEAARMLTDSDASRVWLVDGEEIVAGPGAANAGPLAGRRPHARLPRPSSGNPGRVFREGTTIAGADLLEGVQDGEARDYVVATGQRSFIQAPFKRQSEVAGSITVVRTEVRPYLNHEVATLEAFAAQAAIAIETARAQLALAERNREVTEALERQTATSEVLATIASATTDLDAVLNGLVARAAALLKGDTAGIAIADGDDHGRQFLFNAPEGVDMPVGRHNVLLSDARRPLQRAMREQATVRFAGTFEAFVAEYPDLPAGLLARSRAIVVVPLIHQGNAMGGIWVTRYGETPFAAADIATLETFADQAVIAIENARLFNELQERNREVTEALERETTTDHDGHRASNHQPLGVRPPNRLRHVARDGDQACAGHPQRTDRSTIRGYRPYRSDRWPVWRGNSAD